MSMLLVTWFRRPSVSRLRRRMAAERSVTTSCRGRILYVCQHYPPDLTAGAFRVSETAKWLVRLGFEVSVLTARPHRAQPKGAEPADPPESIQVIRTPILRIGDRGGMWYIFQFLSFAITGLSWGLACAPSKVDYVIASSPPLFVGLPAWFLARLRRAKLVLDIRDLWPDSAVVTGQLPLPRLTLPVGRLFERFMYLRAQLIVCVSKTMQSELTQRVDRRRKVEVIYNAADAETPLGPLQQTGAESHTDLRRIVYAGNIGRSQGLETLVEAAAKFPYLRFQLVGDGVRRHVLEEMAHPLENMEFVGPCTKREALEHLSKGSALFLQLRDADLFVGAIPSKVFDYLTVNRPILYGLRGEGAALLGNCQGNLSFHPGDVNSLCEAIRRLKSEYSARFQAAQKNSSLLEGFTRQKMAKKLAGLLEELSGAGEG